MSVDKEYFTFRLLKRDDLPLFAQWLGEDHVYQWWRAPSTTEYVEQKYGKSIDGFSQTQVYIAEYLGTPIGMIQTYWLKDFPKNISAIEHDNAIGIDYFIGDMQYVNKGYGTRLVAQFIEKIIREKTSATYVFADPEITNPRSIRMLEKVGFVRANIFTDEEKKHQYMFLRLVR